MRQRNVREAGPGSAGREGGARRRAVSQKSGGSSGGGSPRTLYIVIASFAFFVGLVALVEYLAVATKTNFLQPAKTVNILNVENLKNAVKKKKLDIIIKEEAQKVYIEDVEDKVKKDATSAVEDMGKYMSEGIVQGMLKSIEKSKKHREKVHAAHATKKNAAGQKDA